MARSPRFLRPHSVIIKHKTGVEDDDFNTIYEETMLKHVKFDDNIDMSQSNNGSEKKASSVILIDCRDMYARKNCIRCRYITNERYKNQDGYFSIFVGDIVKFDNKEYTITSINEVNPFGKKVEFIEVTCNA